MFDFHRRNFLLAAAITSSNILGCSLKSSVPVSYPAHQPRVNAYNVKEFGALGDGHHDDTDAIQKALDHADKKGGGIVFLPSGQYLIGGSLQIASDVVLEGSFRGPVSHIQAEIYPGPVSHHSPWRGTILLATRDKGNDQGHPFITMENNSCLMGLCIYYPHQNRVSSPVPYPWTIRMQGTNCTIDNVELLNPWQGINATGANRHLIRNVVGQPLKTGIYVDDCQDCGRIENVHFVPIWCQSQRIREMMFHESESFVFGRSDQQYVLDSFSLCYHIGFRFIETKGGVCYGSFLGIGADASWHALVIEQTRFPGLLITNGLFASFNAWSLPDHRIDPVQVIISPSFHGTVRFVNCSFWEQPRHVARIAGNGTVGFSDCRFASGTANTPVIDVDSGSILINGCEFKQTAKQIRLGKNVHHAVITGNLFDGPMQIDNQSKIKITHFANSE
jgi:hypothetical protein